MGANLIGQTLGGKYRLDEMIGEGGFATVYRGVQLDLGRVVAVKVLDERLAHSPAFIERFQREAEATFSLKHRNIVEVFDFQESDGLYYMVMEYVDGPTLRKVLQRQGAVAQRSEDEDEGTRLHEDDEDGSTRLHRNSAHYEALEVGLVAQIISDVCDALTHAHGLGIIHRDLKPDNVLLAQPGLAKLGDFGIARVQTDVRMTRTGLRIGTLSYMSPEQIVGSKTLDLRSDIYSLGIVFYELLAGSPPFSSAEGELAMLQMHLHQAPDPLYRRREGVPPAVEAIVLRCLEKEPGKRYQSAAEVKQALLAVVRPLPISTLLGSKPGTGEAAAAPAPARRPALACPACSAALAENWSVEDACPLCGDLSLSENRRKQAEVLQQQATQFIAGFKLEANLSLDVRAYEYRRAIEPSLSQRWQDAAAGWEKWLQGGSVHAPISRGQPSARLPDQGQVLQALRAINDLQGLWASQAVHDFVVSVQARRQERDLLDDLHGRALQLAGMYRSLKAAQGRTTEEMKTGYEHAWELWQKAAQECTPWQGAPESTPGSGNATPQGGAGATPQGGAGATPRDAGLGNASELAAETAEAILRYPVDRHAAEQQMLRLLSSLEQVKAPWAAADRKMLAQQAGLHQRLMEQQSGVTPAAEQAAITAETKGDDLIRQLRQQRYSIEMAKSAIDEIARGKFTSTWKRTRNWGYGLVAVGVILVLFNVVYSDSQPISMGTILFLFGVAISCLVIGRNLGNRATSKKKAETEQAANFDAGKQVTINQKVAEIQELKRRGGALLAELEQNRRAGVQKFQAELDAVQRVRGEMSAALLQSPLPVDIGDARLVEERLAQLRRRLDEQKGRAEREFSGESIPAPSADYRQTAGPAPKQAHVTTPRQTPAAGIDVPPSLPPAPPLEKSRPHPPVMPAYGRPSQLQRSGGWKIPGSSGSGGFNSDIELAASFALEGPGADANAGRARDFCKTELLLQGYELVSELPGQMQFKRGLGAGKSPGLNIRSFPTVLLVSINPQGGRRLAIDLTGRVTARGGVGKNPQVLEKELDSLYERLLNLR